MAIIHLRETLLLVNFLLFRFIHGLRVAGVVTLQLALSETNLHAVVHRNGAAVHGALHLAGLLHLDNLSGSLDEVSPLDVGHAVAVGLDGGEVHRLLDDLTLLPGHGLAFLFASPNLVSVLINVPVSDTVFLEYCITAFGISGGVLDHIPEGDISTEVFLQSTFTNQGQRKESKDKGQETEGRHG